MIYKNTTRLLLGLLMSLLACQTLLAAKIDVTLDRNRISIEESVKVTFTAIDSPDDSPNFGPLEKDFDILKQRRSSNSSWVNGKYSKKIQWILHIMPKEAGRTKIPSIAFGRDKSPAKALLVMKADEVIQKQNSELFLKAEVSPEKPYVQSQVIYTLKLYSRIELAQASISELEVKDAVVEKLADAKKYTSNLNGVEYRVHELNYAIFPQKSGVMIINPMVLTAELATNSRTRFNGFFNRQMGKTKRIKSDTLTVNVQAVPDKFSGKQWMPAIHVVLEEKWSGDTEAIKVGEPLTRTITLLAIGNTVALLPELHRELSTVDLKTYPDQPVLKEQKRAEGLISFREEKIAYIPSKPGKYTLPAVEIPWFNTTTQTMQVARIAEKIVTATSSPLSQQEIKVIEPPKQSTTLKTVDDKALEAPAVIGNENNVWMWLSLALAFGWLMTMIYIFVNRKPKQQIKPVSQREVKLKETVNSIKKACAGNDPIACKNALMIWGNIKFNCSNLSDIASQSDARLRDEIQLLNQNLYANQTESWQGKKLFQAFTENKAREEVSNHQNNDVLEPLYKA